MTAKENERNTTITEQNPDPAHTKHDRLTSMANELLTLIVDKLEVHDVLSARLTCRKLGDVGLTVIAKRCTRIYLHPTNDSMKVFKEICLHPVLSQNINEIALLGCRIQRPRESSSYRYYMREGLFSAPFWTQYHDYPHQNERRKLGIDLERFYSMEKEQCVAEQNSADLMLLDWALDALPAVTKVSCIFQINEHGLNAQTVWTSKIYQENVAKAANCKDVTHWAIYQNRSAWLEHEEEEFSGRIFSRFLFSPHSRKRTFTSLQLGQYDAANNGIGAALENNALLPGPNYTTVQPTFSLDSVLDLDICVLGTTEQTQETQERVWENFPNLQTIHVRFALTDGVIWHNPVYFARGSILEALLSDSIFPHLRSVILHNQDTVNTPLYEGRMLCDFLIRHKDSLRQLTLFRMPPDECYRDSDYVGRIGPIVSCWMDFLNTIRNHLDLEKAVMKGLFGFRREEIDNEILKEAWVRIAETCMIDLPGLDQYDYSPSREWEIYDSMDVGPYLLHPQ